MDGVINIYKPTGMSSFDVVAKVRKLSKCKKVGHTGTLDPEASGVLPICIGKATKIVDYIMSETKIYVAEMKLGIVTDSYDREGKILENNLVNVTEDQIKEAVNSFIGKIEQIPPMHSALKVNGQRLYELARKGIEIERKSRLINIFDIKILSIDFPFVIMEVTCSKGTYIRSLCYDIGRKLNCGAAMWNLERKASGSFNIEDSIELDKLDCNNLEQYLVPVEEALNQYEKLYIEDDKFVKLLLNGVNIKDDVFLCKIKSDNLFRIYINDDKFIGLGKKNISGFKIEKLLI
ncbi:tRNA pseudouridine(55) synthase TruB [Clostridium omnivorum]|uniref:tRNA pseudouridine synthase B n=1 Tax=Clostridium omnivorum TaxID=1604902 RepID=A0ABQ5NBW8_9CLOT|nr:tRNA pseudouridine(55) synthase TruB [Clostridium sp. E14]GLC32701.1 tRNA pseudouridine synthase B [Clostridium sp. E14]